LPKNWQYFSFHINFRNVLLEIKVSAGQVEINNKCNLEIKVSVYDQEQNVLAMQNSLFINPKNQFGNAVFKA